MSTINKFEMDEATGKFSVLFTDGTLGEGALGDMPVVSRDESGNVTGLQTVDGETIAGGGGSNGKNAFSTLTSSFVQPASAGNVTVSVVDSSFLVQGQTVFVETGGNYSVNSILGLTSVVLTNLGYSGNAVQGTTVSSGSKLSPSGVQGPQGATGATGPQGPSGAGGSTVTSETAVSVTTTATANDATFAVFPSQSCTELELENDTGVEIEYQRGGAGSSIVIRPGQVRRIVGITNANQIGVRRVDYTTTVISRPTLITARALTTTESFVVAGILNVAITNGGANTQLGALACTALELINTSGKTVTWRVGTTAPYRDLREGESIVIRGITNANEVYLKAYDFVARFIRPIHVEAFVSGLTSSLNSFRQARMVAPDARVPLDDFNYPDVVPMPWLSILEQGDQKGTLVPKNATPLAIFSTVANATLSTPARCADSTAGEFLFGTSALEYTSTAANQIETFAPVGVLSAGIDVTGSDIHFEYAMPDNAGVNFSGANLVAFSIELYSAGTPASPGSNYHSASLGSSTQGFAKVDARRGGTIVSFSIPIANFAAVGTGATLTAITWSRFRIQVGASGVKFRPYSIKAVKKALTHGVVCFDFDDLHIGQYTTALPILAKYGYKANLCVDTTVKMGQTGFMSPQQIVTAHQKHGWQCVGQVQGGNGSGTTVDTGISPEHAILQMSRFKGAMKALGVSGTQDYSFGSSSFTSASGIVGVFFDAWPAMKRLFRSSTLFNSGNNATPPFTVGETLPFGDPFSIRRLSMSGFTGGTVYQRYQEHVDQAIANKGVAIFGAHSEFNAPGEPLTAFETLIEYIRTQELVGNVKVMTRAELIEAVY